MARDAIASKNEQGGEDFHIVTIIRWWMVGKGSNILICYLLDAVEIFGANSSKKTVKGR